MKLGKERVFAQTDGGLQIFIPRKDSDGFETDEKVIFERAYYELALEVYSLGCVSDHSPNDSTKLKRVKNNLSKRTSNLQTILSLPLKYLPKCLPPLRILNLLVLIKKYPLLS